MKKSNSQTELVASLLPEAEAVREQLALILASPSFRSSKRYPEFLRYTVEHALTGQTENIKERTLGIEVFGREPNYDSNLDPVVRMTAAEVRKRLEQYYQVRGRENEIHIDFSRGSYVPEFRFPVDADIPSSSVTTVVLPLKAEIRQERWATWLVAFCAILAIVGACSWGVVSSRRSVLDRFWSPIMDSQSPVLLCMPDLTFAVNSLATNPDDRFRLAAISPAAQLPVDVQRDKVSFVDTFALMKVAAAIGKRGKTFRLFHTEDATLDDLKQGPAVLVGGMNNEWINQVSPELRFSLANDGPLRYVSDSKNPSSRQWGSAREQNSASGAAYAIVSRVFNPATGQPVVIAAGVRRIGTEVAGECIADAQCLEEAAKLTSGDWDHANIQLVVQAAVVNGSPGQPHVLAAYLWQHQN